MAITSLTRYATWATASLPSIVVKTRCLIFKLSKFIHFLQVIKDPVGFLCIQCADRKAHVDDDIIANCCFGNVSQVDFFQDPAKAHFSRAHQWISVTDAHYLSWNCQTHRFASL